MISVKSGLKHFLSLTLTVVVAIAAWPGANVTAQTLVGSRYDKLSDSRAGMIATHEIGFIPLVTTSPVGSLVFEFCSNSPVPEENCIAPSGFDASAASLVAQTGNTGFSVHPNTNANTIYLTRVPVLPGSVASTYTLENITNPSNEGTLYMRIFTYSSLDGTGSEIEYGGVALSINPAIDVESEVPPYLTFCVGVSIVAFDCASANSYFIDLGFLDTGQPKFASSQFLVQTNAMNGYSVTLSGTTLTSGSNTIPGLAVPTASTTGTSQFGMNLRANTIPNVGANPVGIGDADPEPRYDTPNQFTFTDGDIIASVDHADYFRKFTVSYITNISPAQIGGVYATTISYICLGNF